MILKTLSRKSVNSSAQLVAYLLRYSLRDKVHVEHKEDAALILRHNLRSRSIKGYIKEFQENEACRLYKRKDSVTLYHNILSFAPDDKDLITDAMLKDIAKKFVELRGKNNIYLAVRHQEKAHKHLHIIVSGVSLNSYSSRVSKQEFKHIKIELEKYQQEKYPELVHSLIDHDKKNQRSKTEIIERVKVTRQSEKQKLLVALEKAYTTANSKEDFLNKVKAQKFDVYERNNSLQGIIVDGQKYRFSRLGYDTQKIEALDYKVPIVETGLEQLSQLRTGKKRVLAKELAPNKSLSLNPNMEEEKLMTDLKDLRSKKHIRGIEQKQTDTAELELERDTNENINHGADTIEAMPNLFSFIDADAVMPGH